MHKVQGPRRRCHGSGSAEGRARYAGAPYPNACIPQGAVKGEQRVDASLLEPAAAGVTGIGAGAAALPPAGFKQIVTASLDKSLAVWTLEGVSCSSIHITKRF